MAVTFSSPETSAENAPRLTDNGLHLNELGYWIAARMIAEQLGCDLTAWQGQVDGAGGTVRVQGGSVMSVETSAEVFRFSVQPDRLLPTIGPDDANSHAPGTTLELAHFQPGKYELRLNGKAFRQFTATDSPQQLGRPWGQPAISRPWGQPAISVAYRLWLRGSTSES